MGAKTRFKADNSAELEIDVLSGESRTRIEFYQDDEGFVEFEIPDEALPGSDGYYRVGLTWRSDGKSVASCDVPVLSDGTLHPDFVRYALNEPY